MTPEEAHRFAQHVISGKAAEQKIELIRNAMHERAIIIRSYYNALIDAGFDQDQAMILTMKYSEKMP